MPLDAALLQAARDAGARLAARELDVELARADYHGAVRALHGAGASLREIAAALDLSHQRVHQIIEAGGGRRGWWRRRRREMVCSFCGRPPNEVARLIAGPEVFICDGCVAAAGRVLAGGAADNPGWARIERAGRCSFCRKAAGAARPLAGAAEDRVCADCLGLCRNILAGT